MTAHAFMAADVLRSLAALCVYPLFVFIPGYVVAWLLDLLGFRRRSAAFQCALSIPLSIAVTPILVYIVGKFASMRAVWAIFVVLWACFLPISARQARAWRRWPSWARPFALAAGIWTLLAVLSLVDLQLGSRVYFSTTALDYAVRSQFIQSISTTGVPPANPFFYPNHTVPLHYHYFWLLVASLVTQVGAPAIGPREAWIAGAAWCGLAVMALVTLFFRLVWYSGAVAFPRRALLGIALLGVTGLDIVPNLGLWILQALGMQHAVQPSGDWWNEQVAGFTSTALWEAHYLCALVCCLTAFLVFWEAPRENSVARRMTYSMVAGMALASAAGAAVYVAFAFAVFLALWTAISIAKRWWRETAVLAAAGVAAVLLFLPYGRDLLAPGGGGVAGGTAPLQFQVRAFSPVDALLRGQGIARGWRLELVNAFALPLNYFLELGVFFAAALIWWRRRRALGKPLVRAELAIGTMVASSILLCTFIRSSVIENNDLGWRGLLIAQFGLLLWAVDVLAERRTAFVTALLALGVVGTVYDALMLRFYPVLADASIVSTAGWMSPDRQFGRRTFAAREAYEWASHAIPASARLQYNPHVILQDSYAFLYSRRQIVAGDEGCLTAFGGNPLDCASILTHLNPYYPEKGAPAPVSIAPLCRTLPIDILVAKDLDAVWTDRQSWVWQEKPLFANEYFRVFGCK